MTKPVEYYLGAALEEGNIPPLMERWREAVGGGSRAEFLSLYHSHATLTDVFDGVELEGSLPIRQHLQNGGAKDIEFDEEIQVTPLTTRSALYSGYCKFTDQDGTLRFAQFAIKTARCKKGDPEQIISHEFWPCDDEEEAKSTYFASPSLRVSQLEHTSPIVQCRSLVR